MNDKNKAIAGAIMLVLGAGLIAWNLRDPYRGLREPPTQKQVVSMEQLPLPLQTAIKRQSAGAVITKIEKETKLGKSYYKLALTKDGHKKSLHIAEDGLLIPKRSKHPQTRTD